VCVSTKLFDNRQNIQSFYYESFDLSLKTFVDVLNQFQLHSSEDASAYSQINCKRFQIAGVKESGSVSDRQGRDFIPKFTVIFINLRNLLLKRECNLKVSSNSDGFRKQSFHSKVCVILFLKSRKDQVQVACTKKSCSHRISEYLD
jgi:hypothetical protein